MKSQLKYCVFLCVVAMVCSCTTQKYIYDVSSSKRQNELQAKRSGYVLGDILVASISIVSSTFTGSEADWLPGDKQFKKLKLLNPTSDTVYVNMLTDIYWDKNDYCDFMDIRIPPKEKCRILVPVEADYNVYFSNTMQSDDDELLQINTSKLNKINLKPGITTVISLTGNQKKPE